LPAAGRFAVLFVALSYLGCQAQAEKPHAPPPPSVYVAEVTRSDLPLYIEAVGSLDGYVNAEIRARVRGYLQRQAYPDGSRVKAGQLLFSIERDEYAVAQLAAKANLSRAQVAQTRNRILLERSHGLFTTGMLSQQDLDNAAAGAADADAQVESARAALRQAELNLSYTEMHSPIDGMAGVALVRSGNLVGQDGPTLLTTVSQLDPIRVNFALGEVDYVKYPNRYRHLEGRDLSWARKQFAKLETGATADGDPGVELELSDGSRYPHRGLVVSINRQIDATTGTIELQALVPNPDQSLRPGQFTKVRIKRVDAGVGVVAVPEKALITVQGSYSVGVVAKDNKVQLRRVTVGEAANGLRVVERGLEPGERIVVDGVQKISDGAPVVPRPAPEAASDTRSSEH
jgi:membrane fusion protein (multidrug efflux system)